MVGWKHSLVKDPADEDAIVVRLIKDDVLSLFDAPKAGMNGIAGTT